jgi:hypothetical protein
MSPKENKTLYKHYGWMATVTIFLITGIVKMTWLVADNTATIKKAGTDNAYMMTTVVPQIITELKGLRDDVNVIRDRQNIVYERMAYRDSSFKVFQGRVMRRFEVSDQRDTRIENYLRLKHIDYQNDNTSWDKGMKPFGETDSKRPITTVPQDDTHIGQLMPDSIKKLLETY